MTQRLADAPPHYLAVLDRWGAALRAQGVTEPKYMIGCGTYGCVILLDDGKVMKLSMAQEGSDEFHTVTEVRLAEFFRRKGSNFACAPKVYGAWMLKPSIEYDGHKFDVACVWREDLRDLSVLDFTLAPGDEDDINKLDEWWELIDHAFSGINIGVGYTSALKCTGAPMPPEDEESPLADWTRLCHLRKTQPLLESAYQCAYRLRVGFGIRLQDSHPLNWGLNEAGQIKLRDMGGVQFEVRDDVPDAPTLHVDERQKRRSKR